MRQVTAPTRQRGVALIMAILIVALATILAVSVASDGYMDQRRTSTMLLMDQAYELALGAEALAAETLQSDDATIDTLNEPWATPIVLPVEDGAGDIKGNLEDLQGRFNLNNLMNFDGTRNDSGVQQFQRLLALLNIDIKFATLTLDWIDADGNPTFPDGAEDTIYAAQTPPSLTPNLPITRASELMSIVGMKYEDYLKLEPFVTALPIDSKLNVCTAPALVLDSLSGTRIEYSSDPLSFAKGRSGGSSNSTCFPTVQDIKTSFAGQDPNFDKLMTDHADYLVQTTNYFRANILVTIGTTEFALYSVLNRTGTGSNTRTRVILRSFGTR